jgi:hypothetical protein
MDQSGAIFFHIAQNGAKEFIMLLKSPLHILRRKKR